MSLRDVSWGDEEEDPVAVDAGVDGEPVREAAARAGNGVRGKPVEWSVDTAGDDLTCKAGVGWGFEDDAPAPVRNGACDAPPAPLGRGPARHEPQGYARDSDCSDRPGRRPAETNGYNGRPGRRAGAPANGQASGTQAAQRSARRQAEENELKALGFDPSMLPAATTGLAFRSDDHDRDHGRRSRGSTDARPCASPLEPGYDTTRPCGLSPSELDVDSWCDEPAPALEAFSSAPAACPFTPAPPSNAFSSAPAPTPSARNDRDLGWGEEPINADVPEMAAAVAAIAIAPVAPKKEAVVESPVAVPAAPKMEPVVESPVASAPPSAAPNSPIMAVGTLPASSSWATCPFCHNCFVHPPVPVFQKANGA